MGQWLRVNVPLWHRILFLEITLTAKPIITYKLLPELLIKKEDRSVVGLLHYTAITNLGIAFSVHVNSVGANSIGAYCIVVNT